MALKLKAWGELRKCQRAEDANAVKGRSADLAQCQTRFQHTLAMIADKATAAGIVCRFHDNGDNTVTDFDTGLMWLKLVGLDGVANGANLLDADNVSDWRTALQLAGAINGQSTDGTTLLPVPGAPPYGDWRLPTIVELVTILDTDAPDCRRLGACIDPIFGPTVADGYWAATTTGVPAWVVAFGEIGFGFTFASNPAFAGYHMRPVRSAL
jgi:hypothetical protein